MVDKTNWADVRVNAIITCVRGPVSHYCGVSEDRSWQGNAYVVRAVDKPFVLMATLTRGMEELRIDGSRFVLVALCKTLLTAKELAALDSALFKDE